MGAGALVMVLWGAVMLIAGYSFAAKNGRPSPSGGGWGLLTVTNYDLAAYVPLPAAGETPAPGDATRKDMDITVAWKERRGAPVAGAFRLGRTYRARITLTAKKGYAFDTRRAFAYDDDEVQSQRETGTPFRRSVEVSYKAAEPLKGAGMTDLTEKIPRPAAGAVPAGRFSAEHYTGRITWEQRDGAAWVRMKNTVFKAGTAYRAVAVLETRPGYTFTGCPDFTHRLSAPGPGAVAGDEPGGKTARLTVTFPSITVTRIADYDLSYYVPLPVAGERPLRSLRFAEMSVTAAWEKADGDGWAPFNGSFFKLEGKYRAVITLRAGDGYVFDENMPFLYGDDAEGLPRVEKDAAGSNSGKRERIVTVVYRPFLRRFTAVAFGASSYVDGSAVRVIRDNAGTAGLLIRLPAGEETLRSGDTVLVEGLSPPIVIIEGAGGPAKTELKIGAARSVITVGAGIALTLRNLTLAGNSANAHPVITVERGGTVTLEDVTIDGNTALSSVQAAGVQVDGGTLIMKNGTISNSTGCGVCVTSGGLFEMYGGNIGRQNGRAGVYVDGGTFNMYGGIAGRASSPAVYVSGGGAFNMYGGLIMENLAVCAVMVKEGNFTMYGDARIPPYTYTNPLGGGRITGNRVILDPGRTVVVGSSLTGRFPAADIIADSGRRVLSGFVPGNNAKFLVNGESNKVDSAGMVT